MTTSSTTSKSSTDSTPDYDADSTGRVAGLTTTTEQVYEVLTEDANGHRAVLRVNADSEADAEAQVAERLAVTAPKVLGVART